MIATQLSKEAIAEQKEAFVERLLKSASGTFDIFTIYIGDRLGFYRALAESFGLTSAQLAVRTGTQERYVREWLEQQTVAGIIEVQNQDASPLIRRYRLPAGHIEVLTERDSLDYLTPLTYVLVGATRPLELLLNAYRHGGGVPYSEYGKEFREGQAGINRSMFLKQLGSEWFPAMPDVHARLQVDPPARIADIGCGAAWSSIGIAQTYPKVQVDGYDLDAPSVDLARKNVQEAGLGDRVQVYQRDASDQSLAGHYDLVTAYGGMEATWVDAFKIIQELSKADGSIGQLYGNHLILSVLGQVAGTPAQAERFYRATAQKHLFWGNAVNTRDTRLKIEPEGNYYRVNGIKSFGTGLLVADMRVISAVQDSVESPIFFVIPKEREGIVYNNDWDNMGQRRTASGSFTFHNVLVTQDEILGPSPFPESGFATLLFVVNQLFKTHVYLGIAEGAFAIAVYAAKAFAIKVGLEIVTRIFEVMGVRATAASYGFDRYWRDLRTFTLHDPVDYKL